MTCVFCRFCSVRCHYFILKISYLLFIRSFESPCQEKKIFNIVSMMAIHLSFLRESNRLFNLSMSLCMFVQPMVWSSVSLLIIFFLHFSRFCSEFLHHFY